LADQVIALSALVDEASHQAGLSKHVYHVPSVLPVSTLQTEAGGDDAMDDDQQASHQVQLLVCSVSLP